MDLLKVSVEIYASWKMDIKQLVIVLRILLIRGTKNPENGLEDCIFETPTYLSLPEWWFQYLTNDFIAFPFQISYK